MMNSENNSSAYTVAVTGATGLVGISLVNYLLARGYSVVAVGRDLNKLEKLRSSSQGNLFLKVAQVEDEGSLKEAFTACDVVIHAAGSVDPYGVREAIFATNYGGTRNALSAAISAEVKHFIHVSSLSVITGQGDQYNVDESQPLRPCGEAYADSKVEAERYVMAEGKDSGIEVTAVRPGFIYGPNERAWLPRLIDSIAHGKAMLVDGGAKETNVIYVENLSMAIEKAILNPRAYNQVYNLTDGQRVSKKQLFDAVSDGMGLPRVKKKIPGSIAKFASETISSLAPLLPEAKQRSLSRFSRAAFRLAGVNQGFSIKKAESELGYTNRVSFEIGMSTTLEAFKVEVESLQSSLK